MGILAKSVNFKIAVLRYQAFKLFIKKKYLFNLITLSVNLKIYHDVRCSFKYLLYHVCPFEC